jgi:L-galactose dehydrogenase
LVERGLLPRPGGGDDGALGFIAEKPGPAGIVDAAYRYARHEPGVDVVLFGTGSIEHLRTNIRSILADPLPPATLERMRERFGHLVGVGLDAPGISARA